MSDLDFLPDDYHARRLPAWVRSVIKSRVLSRAKGRLEAVTQRAVSHPSRSAAATLALAVIAGSGFRSAMGPRSQPARASASEIAAAQHSLRQERTHSDIVRPITAPPTSSMPPRTRPASITGQNEPPDTIHRQMEKSVPQSSDHQKRERVQQFITQAERQLRLQSILAGSRPRALVNGKIVERGDVVASFRVLEIEPRRIIVEREGIRLEIPMN